MLNAEKPEKVWEVEVTMCKAETIRPTYAVRAGKASDAVAAARAQARQDHPAAQVLDHQVREIAPEPVADLATPTTVTPLP